MMNSTASLIQGPRLDLVVMSTELLDACLAANLPRARQVAGFPFSEEFPGQDEWVRTRRNQVVADPEWAPWSLRAIVSRDEKRMVGFTNFHGPPGVNDLGAPAAAEIGYTVFPQFRRRGYATETCRALIEWARREHGVHHFIAGVDPGNGPSLRVIRKLGFVSLGLMIDGEAIFELRVR